MSKRFWIIIAVIAVLFIGILYVSGKNKKSDNTTATGASNHVRGKLDSKVEFVEYGDFQCPVCGAYYPIVSQVMSKYSDRVKFQFRNLPLSQVHPNAFAAARAAEAASEQGKFWEMYDQLFSNQTTWSEASSPGQVFKQYAANIGLDGKKFDTAFASDSVNKTINADIAAFNKTGKPMATPTFFLDGEKLELTQLAGSNGSPTLANFSKAIDAALKAKGAN